jgi:hypothetical protein
MGGTPLDLLLEETKGLYKAEAERYGNLYARIGVYMAVFAIYANALVWFFQNGLLGASRSLGTAAVLVALFAVTVFGFGNLMVALSWRASFSALLGPRFWVARRDGLRQAAYEALLAEGSTSPSNEQIEERVAVVLKEDLVEDLTRCTERNMNLNERRFGFLHRAGQLAGLGFLILVLLIAMHVVSVWRAPAQPPATKVQVIGSDGVTPVEWSLGGLSVRKPEAAPAASAAASKSSAYEAASAATEGNQGGVCSGEDAAVTSSAP